MLHHMSKHRQRLLILMGLLLVVVSLYAQSASAALRACRADPIVWLSNGESVQMTAQIATDANDVRRITYTLHVPEGIEVERIIYTGGALSSKEEVVFVADMPPHHYRTDTVVTAHGRGIDVTAVTAVQQHRGSASGVNNQHLIVDMRLDQ